jgi:hypothetical protein
MPQPVSRVVLAWCIFLAVVGCGFPIVVCAMGPNLVIGQTTYDQVAHKLGLPVGICGFVMECNGYDGFGRNLRG